MQDLSWKSEHGKIKKAVGWDSSGAERFHGKEEAASSNLAPSSMRIGNKIILILIIFLLILVGFLYFTSNKEAENNIEQKSIEIKNNPEQVRQDFIKSVEAQIAELSPEQAVLGGTWHITRIWFADNPIAYIEYEDGHIMRKILVQKQEDQSLKVLAFFEPGEDDWHLVQGEDAAFGQSLDLYEFDANVKEWVKIN